SGILYAVDSRLNSMCFSHALPNIAIGRRDEGDGLLVNKTTRTMTILRPEGGHSGHVWPEKPEIVSMIRDCIAIEGVAIEEITDIVGHGDIGKVTARYKDFRCAAEKRDHEYPVESVFGHQ